MPASRRWLERTLALLAIEAAQSPVTLNSPGADDEYICAGPSGAAPVCSCSCSFVAMYPIAICRAAFRPAAINRHHHSHRRGSSPRPLSQWRMGLHRRSLFLRTLQLSSPGESKRLVLESQGSARRPFPTEYDFSKAPNSKFPATGTRSANPSCSMKDQYGMSAISTTSRKQHTHVFLHVGAANYRSWFWVNGQKVCEHEGGYTSFHCDVTPVIHSGPQLCGYRRR